MRKEKEGGRVKHIKASEIAKIEKGLKARLEQLQNFLRGKIDFPGQEPDLVDQSSGETDLALSLAKHKNARREVLIIQAALLRIERKEFGTCNDCGEPIPAGRLKAVPTTVLCVDCQLEREKKVRGFKHHPQTAHAFVS